METLEESLEKLLEEFLLTSTGRVFVSYSMIIFFRNHSVRRHSLQICDAGHFVEENTSQQWHGSKPRPETTHWNWYFHYDDCSFCASQPCMMPSNYLHFVHNTTTFFRSSSAAAQAHVTFALIGGSVVRGKTAFLSAATVDGGDAVCRCHWFCTLGEMGSLTSVPPSPSSPGDSR